MFAERLDFLMELTNTNNSSLARNARLDPSFVSRLRRGLRKPTEDENYVRAMAVYLSQRVTLPYQVAALAQKLGVIHETLSPASSDGTELVHRWLTEPESRTPHHFYPRREEPALSEVPASLEHSSVYFGIEGKREAVTQLLLRVLKERTPQRLLLYSDEEMSWLTSDANYARKWTQLMLDIVSAGNTVRIIHNINRNADEMMQAGRHWLPLYAADNVEAYYYPKMRDGLLRRSLFVAPHTAAVHANSVGNTTSNSASFLTTNKGVLHSLVEEFNYLWLLCKPLLHIFNQSTRNKNLHIWSAFSTTEANSVVLTHVPASFTVPAATVHTMLMRSGCPKVLEALEQHNRSTLQWEASLERFVYTELVKIPSMEEIESGRVKASFSEGLTDRPLYYTKSDLIAHIQNIVRLLQKHDNYNLFFVETHKLLREHELSIHVKEDYGVICSNATGTATAFLTTESALTSTFWHLAKEALQQLPLAQQDKGDTVRKLLQLVTVLQQIP